MSCLMVAHFTKGGYHMRYDANRIIEDADPFEVVQATNIEWQKKGKNVFIRCPGHLNRIGKEDQHVNNAWLTKHGYFCSVCGVAVNTVSMVMEARNCTYREALEFVADLNGGRELYVDKDSTTNFQTDKIFAPYGTYDYSKKQDKKCKMLPWNLQDEIGLNIGSNKSFYPIFCYTDKPEENAEKTGRIDIEGNIEYEWLVMDRTKKMSLADLYKDDYEAYLWLITSKCEERLEIINDCLKHFSSQTNEFCVNMKYVLTQKADFVKNIYEEHAKELERIQQKDKKKLKAS